MQFMGPRLFPIHSYELEISITMWCQNYVPSIFTQLQIFTYIFGKVIIYFGPNIVCVLWNLLFEYDFLCYHSILPSVLFTFWVNELLHDWTFNVGSNISTGIDALDYCLKYDPSEDTIISLTYATVLSSNLF